MVSFFKAFPPKFCVHYSSPPVQATCAWIWSPEFFVMSSEASSYAVFSTHLLLADVHCKHRVVRTQAAVVLGVGSSFRPMWVISFTPRAYYLRGEAGWTADKLWIWWRRKCLWYCPENSSWLPACSHSVHSPNCPHSETVWLNISADEEISLWIHACCMFFTKIQRACYRRAMLQYIIYFGCILRFIQWLRLCAVEC